jgi:hypothetical protein
MPDIAMCSNHECPAAKLCYRHEAKPEFLQWYDEFRPDMSGKCIDFMPLRGRVPKRETEKETG